MSGERVSLLAKQRLKRHLWTVFHSPNECDPKLALLHYLRKFLNIACTLHLVIKENTERKGEYQQYSVLNNQKVTHIHLQLSGESCMTLKFKVI